MDNPQDITVLSLCSGYGGLELGLARALANPFRVVAVEIEAYALANLVAKAEEGKLAIEALWPDLRTFPAERFRGCFDFILAGYPCQPFSVAGKRQGADDPRHLWPAIARIVAAVEPLWCFFENVPGHLSLGFPDVYCSLRSMGYQVEAGLFSASECGAPHRRQRLFVMAKSCRATGGNQGGQADGRLGQADVPQGNGQTGSVRAGAAGELADDPGSGLQAGQSEQTRESNAQLCGEAMAGSEWPARPGEPQYEWEEPRVVSYTSHRGCRQLLQQKQKCGGSTETDIGSNGKRIKGKAQRRLGRATDESASGLDATGNRVDRLRLLGNGVVPQQAERAFRELFGHFEPVGGEGRE